MSQITITETVIPNWHGGDDPILKIFANQDFLSSDNVLLNKQKVGGSQWYKSVQCSVAGSDLTIPQFTIDSTTDSSRPNGTYTAVLYDSNGYTELDRIIERFRVPDDLGSSIGLDEIVAYNADDVPNHAGLTYTQEQTNALITAVTALLEDKLDITDILRSRLEANVDYSANIAPADTALSVTVEAAGKYDFKAVLHVTASGSGGFRARIGGTSTDTAFIAQYLATSTTGTLIGGGRAVLRSTAIAIAGTTMVVTIWGSVEINAGGTFLVMAAQNTSDAINSSLLKGSTLVLIKTN